MKVWNSAKKVLFLQVTSRGLSKIAQGSLFFHQLQQQQRPGSGSGSRAFSTDAKSEHSHVIVGAGSAGCVLANRLTEDRDD